MVLPSLLMKEVICLAPAFQPMRVALREKASTKTTDWAIDILKPSVSALSSSALHPLSKIAFPCLDL